MGVFKAARKPAAAAGLYRRHFKCIKPDAYRSIYMLNNLQLLLYAAIFTWNDTEFDCYILVYSTIAIYSQQHKDPLPRKYFYMAAENL